MLTFVFSFSIGILRISQVETGFFLTLRSIVGYYKFGVWIYREIKLDQINLNAKERCLEKARLTYALTRRLP